MNFLSALSGTHPFVLSLLGTESPAVPRRVAPLVPSSHHQSSSSKVKKTSRRKKSSQSKKKSRRSSRPRKSSHHHRKAKQLEADNASDDELGSAAYHHLAPAQIAAQIPVISSIALGVSATFLRELLNDRGIKEGMTTADVCREVVLPRTQAFKSSMHDVLQAQTPYFVAPATVFVSHAWKYNFREVVGVMLAYAEECKQANQPTCFFYFDLFAHSQHSAPDYPQEWWSTTFKTRVGSIGTTLLVLSPWDDPIPLARSWCLFELWSTIEQKAKLVLRLPQSQQVTFKNALLRDFNSVMAAMVKIDAERASAFHEKDKIMIAKTIRESCGFSSLNASVKDLLRDWLLSTGQQLLREHKDSSGDVTATAKFEISLGALTSQLGRYDEAAKLYKSAFKALQHVNPSGAATAAMNLGLAWGNKNNPSKVVRWMQRSLDVGKNVHTSAEISNIKIALGNAHIDQGHPAKALPMFLEALKESQKCFGDMHHKTAFAFVNVGMAYQELKDFKQAEAYYMKAVPIFTATDGKLHPQTASAMHGLAVARLHLGMVGSCIELEEQILKIYTENYGTSHPFTKQTVKTLEVARGRHSDTKKSLMTARNRSRSRGMSDDGPLNHARYASEEDAGSDSDGPVYQGSRGRRLSLDLTHERATSCASPFAASPKRVPSPTRLTRVRQTSICRAPQMSREERNSSPTPLTRVRRTSCCMAPPSPPSEDLPSEDLNLFRSFSFSAQ